MEALLIKAKIDAGADDIVSEENSSSVGPAVIEKIIRGPEVGMDIFNLHRPLRRECPFNATACGPSGATVGYDQTACSGATNLNATIGKGGAPGSVEQPLAPHVAEPTAQCVDPRFGYVVYRGRNSVVWCRPMLARQGHIVLDADHPARGELPVATDLPPPRPPCRLKLSVWGRSS